MDSAEFAGALRFLKREEIVNIPTVNQKVRIMVIDDEELIRQTLRENLADAGYQVVCAEDGADGLRMLVKHKQPDIVITDIIMPRKEGIETIAEIKRCYPNIKIIAISGGGRFATGNFLEFAEKLGADAALPKPVDMQELEGLLRELTP
jgi:YesN/AraC family two-component response regulator